MNSTSIKWLIAGFAGALISTGLVSGAIYFSYTLLKQEIGGLVQAEGYAGAPPGNDAEAERRARKREKEQRERENLIARLGLHDIYETVYLLEGTRNRLYYDEDFAAVETDLARLRANTDTPFDRYRYTRLVTALGHIHDGEEYPKLLSVLNTWADVSPDSYFPLLARGHLYTSVAWVYRGTGYAHRVPEADMEAYRKYHQLAWADLNAARKMNQDDPEIPAALARAAAGTGRKLADIRKFHDETLALNPHHVEVRYTLMDYSLPQWFGSWGEIDALLDEFEQASEDFPYLASLIRNTADMMRIRGPRYFSGSEGSEIKRRVAAGMKAQVALNPDEPYLLGMAARYALDVNDYATAADCFERLGMRYPPVSVYRDIRDFHWWRLHALAQRSADPEIIGTPRERELLELARAARPDDANVNGMYLAYLARVRDDAQTRAFFESDPGAFYQTADITEPYDYDLLRGMALAARSDDYGVHRTNEERRLLAEAMELAPDNALVRLIQAEHHISAKDYELARPHLEHARAVDPDYLPALLTEGWLHYHQKRWDEGIAAASAFLARDPAPYVVLEGDQAREIIELCERKRAAEQ